MNEVLTDNVNIRALVDLLKDDVRRRGLRPGDRYLTAVEVREQFNVSEISAHRAMQMLAEDDFLVRRRGSGTFVGTKFQSPVDARPPFNSVHVLLSMDHHRTASLPAELFVDRLYSALPGATVEVHYVPEYDSLAHLARLLDATEARQERDRGFILIRSSRAMQLYIEQAGVPAVAFGHVHTGVEKLPWLDVDQAAIGALMAGHLHAKGHRRFLLLMRDDWRHGDNIMALAVARELGRNGHATDALVVHSVPPEHDHIVVEVKALLAENPQPTGIMCRTHRYAAAVEAALSSLDAKARSRVDVVVGSGGEPVSGRHAYVTAVADETEQVETLARMLVETTRGDTSGPRSVVLPVQLRDPSGSTRKR